MRTLLCIRPTWAAPLPFPDGAFDDAIACLVLHYLEDWKAPLTELRRVLAPGGRLIVAVNHPFVYHLQYPHADYFAPCEYSEEYTFSGQTAELSYWHRPLHAMTSAFTEAGFRIAVVSEPPPAPGARERFPEVFKEIFGNLPSPTAFLSFLFFVLESPDDKIKISLSERHCPIPHAQPMSREVNLQTGSRQPGFAPLQPARLSERDKPLPRLSREFKHRSPLVLGIPHEHPCPSIRGDFDALTAVAAERALPPKGTVDKFHTSIASSIRVRDSPRDKANPRVRSKATAAPCTTDCESVVCPIGTASVWSTSGAPSMVARQMLPDNPAVAPATVGTICTQMLGRSASSITCASCSRMISAEPISLRNTSSSISASTSGGSARSNINARFSLASTSALIASSLISVWVAISRARE